MSRVNSFLAAVVALCALTSLAHANGPTAHSSHLSVGPSSPSSTAGNKFAGLAGQNYQINTAGNYNRENALMGQNTHIVDTRFPVLAGENYTPGKKPKGGGYPK